MLPRADWDAYYARLRPRLRELESTRGGDPDARALVESTQAELDAHAQFGDAYGYAFFVAAVTGGSC